MWNCKLLKGIEQKIFVYKKIQKKGRESFMNKTTKKSLMRLLALVMAVIMVATSGAFSSDGWLKANETETASEVDVEEVAEETEDVEEPEEEQQEDVQGETEEVEIEIPAEPTPEPVVEETPEVEEAAPVEEVSPVQDTPPVESTPAPVAEETLEPVVEEGVPNEEEILEVAEEGQEKTYKLYIKHELPAEEGTYGQKEEIVLKDSDFVDGKYNGKGKFTRTDCSSGDDVEVYEEYEGDFVDGEFNGKGKLTIPFDSDDDLLRLMSLFDKI